MSSRPLLPLFFFLLIVPLHSLLATDLSDARWNGSDFVMTFTDSVRYTVDLAESDSTRVVIRIDGVEPGSLASERQMSGPGQRSAILTATPQGIRLTVTSPTRLGYSTIQHPYSHRLVIHTFDWNGLSYGEDQYHKGLLAYEGKYNVAAEEMLKIAEATGETRARTALGTFYLAQGRDSLAGIYLDSAITADDFAARAELRRRSGDSLTAAREQEIARMMVADEASAGSTDSAALSPVSRESPRASRATNEIYYLAGGALLLLLIVAAIFFFTRKTPSHAVAAPEGRIAPRRPLPPQPETPVVVPTQPVAESPRSVPPPTPVVEQPVVTEAPLVVEQPIVVQQPTVVEQPIVAEAPTVVEQPISTPPVVEQPPVVHATEPDRIETDNEKIPAVTTIEELSEPIPAVTTVEEIEERFPAVTTIQELEPVGDDEMAPAPIVTSHPRETMAEAPEIDSHGSTTRLPSQAAELQRKIQAVRRDTPAPSEPTVHAARRLNVSRDNVELRRMMEEAAKKNQ